VVADIVETAIAIADAEGLDAVSMRRVSRDMGMGTMSLYWYVEGKDDLIDLMFDDLMGGQLLEEPEFADWRTGLRAIARRSRAVFERHPWLINVMSGHRSTGPNIIRHIDQSLRITDGLGLDLEQRMMMLTVVDDFVVGRLRRQAAEQERAASGYGSAQEWLETNRPFIDKLIADEGLEHLGPVLDQVPQISDVDLFERGLEAVLNGLAATFGLT
jgi:AcrR family transcriptional regulator